MTSTHAGSMPTSSSTGTFGRIRAAEPAEQAFMILRAAFTVAPILFGADKFFHLMVNWDKYLAPALSDPLPFTPHQQMYVVGVVEILPACSWRSTPAWALPSLPSGSPASS